jgi:glycosyltransferase involved in cell wall biosynthesis
MKESVTTKNILMIAFQFPPMSGSSGLLRVLKFCKYLPEFGWTPTVVTADPRMYEQVNEQQLSLIPKGLEVIRAFGLDSKRHLSIYGRYPRSLALPDTSASWSFCAILSALRVMRRKKVEMVLTTFPIATAVWIGLVLHRLTGKPWILDLRDSMTEDNYPRDPSTFRVWRWLERLAIQHASLVLFTARSAIRMYRSRYPELAEYKCLLLPNGYDEEDFVRLQSPCPTLATASRPFQLLHSGLVYPEERDPLPFFRALARLSKEGKISSKSLQVNFRAPGFEDKYSKIIQRLGLEDIVNLLPRIPYTQALEEYLVSDALLLMQAKNCDHQIPAKAYEYFRLGKPILALTSENGDTASLLRDVGGSTIVNLHDEEAVYLALPRFIAEVATGNHAVPSHEAASRFSRRSLTKDLANHLDQLVDSGYLPVVEKPAKGAL